MANLSMAARRLLDKYDVDVPEDFLHDPLELFVNLLMEAEVSQVVGAERYERTADRTNRRNGVRHRRWVARLATIDLKVPLPVAGCNVPEGQREWSGHQHGRRRRDWYHR